MTLQEPPYVSETLKKKTKSFDLDKTTSSRFLHTTAPVVATCVVFRFLSSRMESVTLLGRESQREDDVLQSNPPAE